MRIAFAGDRNISVSVLKFLLSQDVSPLALIVPDEERASHGEQLITFCSFLPSKHIMRGSSFKTTEGIAVLRELDLDYIICIHFPYIIPEPVLSIPRYGVINLHPAFLPFNRGWHTPSWSILEDTPIGATLHFMNEGIDTGDIICQELLPKNPEDTAHSLYKKVNMLELEIFKKCWPQMVTGSYKRKRQTCTEGTVHKRDELFSKSIQKIDLDTPIEPRYFIRKLRALTTSRIEEAAYFKSGNKWYRVQVIIREET